jgi:septum formation protein
MIVLSSMSPARFALMQQTQLTFSTYNPNIDETLIDGECIETAVKRLAIAKAKAASSTFPNAIIIGADQLLTVNQQTLGKPHTHQKAVGQLTLCSGQTLNSYTGLAVYNSETQHLQAVVVPYQVKFKLLSLSLIERYLLLDQPYFCAGSIKAESLGFRLFEWMRGDDPTALTGLPLITLSNMLLKEQIDITKTKKPRA